MSINNNQISSQSTGNATSAVQFFSQNYVVDISYEPLTYFVFQNPVYSVQGCTTDYYAQDVSAVSYNLNNVTTYTLIFSGNSQSISGNTFLVHDLYRIPYADYLEVFTGGTLTQDVINDVATPVVEFIENGYTVQSGITISGWYTFSFPSVIKPTGQYTSSLFQDKDQFFIDTRFLFPVPVDQTIGAIQTISGGSVVTISAYPTTGYTYLESSLLSSTITGNTPFSGLSVGGAFFTFFVPPKKPDLYVVGGNSSIAVQGNLNTYAPIFNFAGVGDGDYYKLECTYDLTDTTFIGDTVVTYDIPLQPGDDQFVRTFSTPLRPNQSLLYRIGNTKEIIDIFAVKQNLTTWSNNVPTTTANDGQYTLSGITWKNYVGGFTMNHVTLSLLSVVTNSSIDIFIDAPTNPNIFNPQNVNIDVFNKYSLIETTSGPDGAFDLGRINSGTYLLLITPPAIYSTWYPTTLQQISITGNTSLDIVITGVWGNDVISMYDDGINPPPSPETFL